MSPHHPRARFDNGEQERRQGKRYSLRVEIVDDDNHFSSKIEPRQDPADKTRGRNRTHRRLAPEVRRRPRELSIHSNVADVGARPPSPPRRNPRRARHARVVHLDADDSCTSPIESEGYCTDDDVSGHFARKLALDDRGIPYYPIKYARKKRYHAQGTQTEAIRHEPSATTTTTPPPIPANYNPNYYPIHVYYPDAFADGYMRAAQHQAAALPREVIYEARERERGRAHDAQYYRREHREHREPRRRSRSRHREARYYEPRHRDARRRRSPSPQPARGHREHRRR